MEQRRRILLVEGSGRGFLSHYAHALALGLHEAGQEVTLVTGRRDELANWPVPFAKDACLADSWAAWFCLARLVRKLRPDVVHLQWVGHPVAARLFVAWARQRAIRVAYTPHNLLPHRRRWLLQPWFRHLYGAVDRVVARDPHIAWGLEEVLGVPERKVVVLPGSPNLMAHPAAPRTAVAGLPPRRDGEARVLFFGHGSGRKGLRPLLDVLASREWPASLHLVVVGEGVLRRVSSQALDAARMRCRVSVVDRYVDPAAVAGLFGEADLLVMPYVKQCKSPLLDLAAAFALPVLRTERVEAVRFQDGLHGLTIPAGDGDSLAAALDGLTGDPSRLAVMREALRREEAVAAAICRLTAGHLRLYADMAAPAADPSCLPAELGAARVPIKQ
jgi:glycosyltransferase involved in cell wall biosynthesis